MSLLAIKARAADLRARFEEAGAQRVDCPILLPAETLLDLYGEDIRTRAYVTSDPARGEVMLRPDFTVPVVQMHMEEGADPARYTYAGEIFRRQEVHPDRVSEYHQVGYEIFDRDNPAAADAEVFARFSDILSPFDLHAVLGDIGLLIAAVDGLETSQARRAALMRHIWRPRRFRALLERYSGRAPVPQSRIDLLAAEDPLSSAGPAIGLREESEVLERVAALKADAAEAPLSEDQVALLDSLVRVSATCSDALGILRDIAVDLASIGPAVDRLAHRFDALSDRGIDLDRVSFDANFGRTSMEYYDGFVFGFAAPDKPGWPLVASGGRYDALTRHLGEGREIPAVGGVIRPGLLNDLEAGAGS